MGVVKIYVETYGCAANVADSEIALGLLRQAGHEFVSDPRDADVIIIFTCVVKKPTSDRMLYRISKLAEYGKRLIVAGCIVPGEPEKVKRIAPEAIMLHPRAITKIRESVELGRSFWNECEEVKLCLPRIRKNPIIAIIPASEGCSWGLCSFCIVARTRGSFRSYPIDLIECEAKRCIEEGVREIWLTSQDMGSYGIESGKSRVAELVKRVAGIDGVFFVRVGMMNPLYIYSVLEELAEAYQMPKVFKFLHIPVQSGSNKILRDMRRGYDVRVFKRIVEFMRSKIPGLTLSTDIIVGYPTEDESDFEETVKLVEDIKPDMINISRFFPRPRTPAEKLKPLDPRIVKKRSKLLSEVAREIALKNNERWIGWRGLALVDEIGERGEAIARNPSYRPIVIRGCGKELFGKFVEVEVEGARPYCLLAEFKKILEPLEIAELVSA